MAREQFLEPARRLIDEAAYIVFVIISGRGAIAYFKSDVWMRMACERLSKDLSGYVLIWSARWEMINCSEVISSAGYIGGATSWDQSQPGIQPFKRVATN